MISNSTYYFPKLLLGAGTIPARRGSPRGCSEHALRDRRPGKEARHAS